MKMSLRSCFALLLFFIVHIVCSQDTANKVLSPVAQADSVMAVKDSVKSEVIADSNFEAPTQKVGEIGNSWAGKAFLVAIILLLLVLALIGIKFGKYND